MKAFVVSRLVLIVVLCLKICGYLDGGCSNVQYAGLVHRSGCLSSCILFLLVLTTTFRAESQP